MAKKQSISFSRTEKANVFTQKMTIINLKILNSKSKSEESKYQKQLSTIIRNVLDKMLNIHKPEANGCSSLYYKQKRRRRHSYH